mgnify:CR=1 FL=1
MTNDTINYKQIYEDEITQAIKETLEKPRFYSELSHQERMMIEELVDIGYQRAISDALDPEVLADTAALAGEMGTQLYHFANLLQEHLKANDENSGETD